MLYEGSAAESGVAPFEVRALSSVAWSALQFALRRTSGLMIFAARPRYASCLAAFRQFCRREVPVQSRYERFDLIDALAEDVRGLLRVGLKGDAVDVGLVCANAFEALRVLVALGVPQHMLGSEYFLAGVVHLHAVRRIARPEMARSLGGSVQTDLFARLSMALSGATEGVRLRHPEDEGRLFWYADVLLPDPEMCAMLQQGDFRSAWNHWCTLSSEMGSLRAYESALKDVAAGLVDPTDFEAEFGPIHWEHAVRDRVLQGYEVRAGQD